MRLSSLGKAALLLLSQTVSGQGQSMEDLAVLDIQETTLLAAVPLVNVAAERGDVCATLGGFARDEWDLPLICTDVGNGNKEMREVKLATCGNGVVETVRDRTEQCDGGEYNGQGVCTEDCKWEPVCLAFQPAARYKSGNNYVQLPGNTFEVLASSTMDFWLKFHTYSASTSYIAFLEQHWIGLTREGYLLVYVFKGREGGSGDARIFYYHNHGMEFGEYNHVAVVLEGAVGTLLEAEDLHVYINGEDLGLADDVQESNLSGDYKSDVLGMRGDTDGGASGIWGEQKYLRTFDGELGFFLRGWTKAMTQEEIQAVMFVQTTTDPDLHINYRFDTRTPDVLTDSSGNDLHGDIKGYVSYCSACGDGHIGFGEECDPGAADNSDGLCDDDCQMAPFCIDFQGDLTDPDDIYTAARHVQLPPTVFEGHPSATIEFWWLFEGTDSSTGYPVFTENMWVGFHPDEDIIISVFNSRAGGEGDMKRATVAKSTHGMTYGEWNHVAVVAVGTDTSSPVTELHLYVNGEHVNGGNPLPMATTNPENKYNSDLLGAIGRGTNTAGIESGVLEAAERGVRARLGLYTRGWSEALDAATIAANRFRYLDPTEHATLEFSYRFDNADAVLSTDSSVAIIPELVSGLESQAGIFEDRANYCGVCGDGIVQEDIEECDNGNKFGTDICDNECKYVGTKEHCYEFQTSTQRAVVLPANVFANYGTFTAETMFLINSFPSESSYLIFFDSFWLGFRASDDALRVRVPRNHNGGAEGYYYHWSPAAHGIVTDEVYHIALVVTGEDEEEPTSVKVYVNGVDLGLPTETSSPNTNSYTANIIGGHGDTNGGSGVDSDVGRRFSMRIQYYVRTWSSARSLDEITHTMYRQLGSLHDDLVLNYRFDLGGRSDQTGGMIPNLTDRTLDGDGVTDGFCSQSSYNM